MRAGEDIAAHPDSEREISFHSAPPSEAGSPWRSTLGIVIPGIGSTFAMFLLLASLQISSPAIEALVGTIFMTAVMVPIVHLVLLRPLRRELQARREADRVLREAGARLEDRVRERTAELEHAHLQLQESLQALERTHNETSLISELLELLQACGNESESRLMMAGFGPRLFPEQAGAVYLYRASRNVLELATGWPDDGQPAKVISPGDCWGLRRGRDYLSVSGGHDVCCAHFSHTDPKFASGLCIPMMANGETTGLLVLQNGTASFPDAAQKLARIVAERIGLAMANLQLHEKLRNQAIRDPLTAMYNRRYFEETAGRELLRAGENGSPVGIIMIDVDRFKLFNDSYGHEAGDAVLQRVGLALQSHSRVEDVVCRYGGEEFVMLLPGLAAGPIVKRAEELREAIRELHVRFHGETLAKITISCGVAVFPGQGHTCEELIDAADHALYRAKQAGRDRVELAA